MTNTASPRPNRPGPAATGGPASAASSAAASAGPAVPIILEVSGWAVLFGLAALAFGLAGAQGFVGAMSPGEISAIHDSVQSGGFAMRSAALSLLATFAFAAAGLFVPHSLLGSVTPHVRRIICGAAALAAAASALVLVFVPAAWLCWIVSVLLGLCIAMHVLASRDTHQKPWRTAGVAGALLLFLTYAFQLVGGVEAGIAGVRWYLGIGAAGLAVAGVLVLLAPPARPKDTGTGAFPASALARGLREPIRIARPWACHLLYGVLGAVFALALPSVAGEQFGQAGFAVILCFGLLGWAVGFETGPTFAPGMTRPRLTSFALVGTGLLLPALGAIEELSGKAVVSAAVAFAVGIGVRAQPYEFSRRIGFGAGAVIALVLVAFGLSAEIPLSDEAMWSISPAEVAYGVIGVVVLVAGIVALFTFSPQGIQGIGVDVVHAFRTPGPREAADQAPASADQAPAAAVPGEAPVGSGARPGARRMTDTGVFIALEGGDGSGKSTHAEILAEHLRSRGARPVVVTREPGGTPAGSRIRSVLLDGDGVSPRSEALLFAADRAHHVAELVEPTLRRDGIVITDRYVDSSLSYQAAGRALPREEIAELSRWATDGLVPHLTIVLDVDGRTAAERTAGRGEENHLDAESAQFRDRVRRAFLDLAHADPARYAVIDASRPRDVVAADVIAAVDACLAGRPAEAGGDVDSSRPPARRHDVPPAGEVPAPPAAPVPPAAPAPPSAPAPTTGSESASADPATSAPEGAPPSAPPSAPPGASVPPPTIAPAGAHASGGTGAPASAAPDDDEAATTVLPSASADDGETSGEAATTVLPNVAADDDGGGADGAERDGEEAATTVLPAASADDPAQNAPSADTAGHRSTGLSRQRLHAQAELERQARERLRQARLRRSGRESGPDGTPR